MFFRFKSCLNNCSGDFFEDSSSLINGSFSANSKGRFSLTFAVNDTENMKLSNS